MIKYLVARCYSKALFRFSTSNQELEKRSTNLEDINRTFAENPRLFQYLDAPEISLEEKKDFYKKIFAENFDPLLYKFIFFLQEKNRLHFLADITEEYSRLVHKKLGMMEVQVISPQPLDQVDKENLKLKIQQSYPDKEINFIEKLDPELIGGLIAIIDKKAIDFSVKNRLSNLKDKLLALPI